MIDDSEETLERVTLLIARLIDTELPHDKLASAIQNTKILKREEIDIMQQHPLYIVAEILAEELLAENEEEDVEVEDQDNFFGWVPPEPVPPSLSFNLEEWMPGDTVEFMPAFYRKDLHGKQGTVQANDPNSANLFVGYQDRDDNGDLVMSTLLLHKTNNKYDVKRVASLQDME